MDFEPESADRRMSRDRPGGVPVMHQSWGSLLFLHWRVEAEQVRPLIPERLSVDTFEGSAWITVVPFTSWGLRASFMPPVPFLSEFHELNVRTYVHVDGVPGVWFLSLDANSRAAVWAARTSYHLPYFHADIALTKDGERIVYDLKRTDDPPASLHARWTIGGNARIAAPDTLELFLVERYCLYAARGRRLFRARIHHEPWPLNDARLEAFESSMIESHGLPTPDHDPLLQCSPGVSVEIWAPDEL